MLAMVLVQLYTALSSKHVRCIRSTFFFKANWSLAVLSLALSGVAALFTARVTMSPDWLFSCCSKGNNNLSQTQYHEPISATMSNYFKTQLNCERCD